MAPSSINASWFLEFSFGPGWGLQVDLFSWAHTRPDKYRNRWSLHPQWPYRHRIHPHSPFTEIRPRRFLSILKVLIYIFSHFMPVDRTGYKFSMLFHTSPPGVLQCPSGDLASDLDAETAGYCIGISRIDFSADGFLDLVVKTVINSHPLIFDSVSRTGRCGSRNAKRYFIVQCRANPDRSAQRTQQLSAAISIFLMAYLI